TGTRRTWRSRYRDWPGRRPRSPWCCLRSLQPSGGDPPATVVTGRGDELTTVHGHCLPCSDRTLTGKDLRTADPLPNYLSPTSSPAWSVHPVGRAYRLMARKWAATPAMTSRWKTSWEPKGAGTGWGRRGG